MVTEGEYSKIKIVYEWTSVYNTFFVVITYNEK
jgi:hypothetical protein